METSDSEYFESADEDFISDNEAPNEKKQLIKGGTDAELIEKTEKLCVDENVTSKCIEKVEKLENKDAAVKKEKKDTSDADTDKAIIDGGNSVDKNTRINRVPQSRTECWEPGMDYDIKKSKEACQKQFKRPEYGIPPTRVGGCFSRIRENPQDKGGFGAKYQIPPAESNAEKASVKEKPKRPEFGIPPARTTCWVPGVTDANNSNHPFEPHPAYLKLMKEREQKETQEKSEFGIPPARTSCWMPPGFVNRRKSDQTIEPHPAYLNLEKEQKQKQNEEESLVTNRDEAQKGKLEEPKQKDVQEAERSDVVEKSKKADNKEENMWEKDDWGDFDTPTNQDNQTAKCKTEIHIKDEEENMWGDDEDWEPVESNTPSQNQQKSNIIQQVTEERSSWGDWGNWGLSSVLSTATTLTTQVSQGITNVLETGIGAPDPEEMARINKLEKDKVREMTSAPSEEIPADRKPILGFGLGNLMHGMTKLVETTGTKVISGGLDTLETIGKKTMEVLQENDPGLKKKRAFLKLDDDKPILSHMLREAKEKAEIENRELERKHFARRANYETLFDDHQGLVHLEALEMLSRQCDIKLQSLIESASGDALNDMQETLDQVKELCELPEEDDEETLSTSDIREKLESAVSEININITYAKLLTTWQDAEDWLAKLNLNICNKNELHQQAIESLAQLTAIAVEQFHKAGELLLIKENRSTADEADSLVQLTTTLTTLIGIVAARFSEKLNMIVGEDADKEAINNRITNVFFEAANSSSYVQDAFQLLIPVLQVGAV